MFPPRGASTSVTECAADDAPPTGRAGDHAEDGAPPADVALAFPDTLPGRLAAALWEQRPEGRQKATVKAMMAALEAAHPEFKPIDRRRLQAALPLLKGRDAERWPLKARNKPSKHA
jgi:hypothetical protein